MNSRRALAALLAVGVLVPAALTVTSAASASAAVAPEARNDKATVVAGKTTTVAVLANDTVTKKIRATVRVVAAAQGLVVTVTPKRTVRIKTATSTLDGFYTIRYRVTDTTGRADTATIRVTVLRASSGPNVPQNGPSTLHSMVKALPVADEHRHGYDRDLFHLWIDADKNGCDTRREVLIAEATVAPTIGAGCAFTGGSWTSYYDGVTTTDSSKFDIDHVVPLAEAWDSGASAWTPQRREAYANDLGDPRSLVAVSASSNRSKGDRDPAEWLPALDQCRYVTDWTVVKYRWALTVDATEKAALWRVASGCADVGISYTPAP